MAKPKDRVSVSGERAELKQPLAGLAGLSALRDQLPSTEPKPEPAPPSTTNERNPIAKAKKLVVRRERKGHGGKTATRIEGLSCTPSELNDVLRDLKRGLGCGATIDGDDILVQGDQTDRVSAFLQSRGARKVVVGN